MFLVRSRVFPLRLVRRLLLPYEMEWYSVYFQCDKEFCTVSNTWRAARLLGASQGPSASLLALRLEPETLLERCRGHGILARPLAAVVNAVPAALDSLAKIARRGACDFPKRVTTWRLTVWVLKQAVEDAFARDPLYERPCDAFRQVLEAFRPPSTVHPRFACLS